MSDNIIIGQEPTHRDLVISAMVGCILYFDDLEIGEITRVKVGNKWFVDMLNYVKTKFLSKIRSGLNGLIQ